MRSMKIGVAGYVFINKLKWIEYLNHLDLEKNTQTPITSRGLRIPIPKQSMH